MKWQKQNGKRGAEKSLRGVAKIKWLKFNFEINKRG